MLVPNLKVGGPVSPGPHGFCAHEFGHRAQPETLTQLNECSEGLLSVYVVTFVIPIQKDCIVYNCKV